VKRVALVLVLVAAGCGGHAAEVPPGAIAVVGDRTITRAQLDALHVPAGKQDSAVRLLVEQAELEQEATKLGILIDSKKVEARFRRLKASLGGERGFRERLRGTGQTPAKIRAAIHTQLLIEGLKAAVAPESFEDWVAKVHKAYVGKTVYAQGFEPSSGP
jgi:hypothetical protein